MTARQPPGEKGANACTTGSYQSRDWYFCACFPGEYQKRGAFLYSEPHIVKTRLGTFSLDDAAYAAYLDKDYEGAEKFILQALERSPGDPVLLKDLEDYRKLKNSPAKAASN